MVMRGISRAPVATSAAGSSAACSDSLRVRKLIALNTPINRERSRRPVVAAAHAVGRRRRTSSPCGRGKSPRRRSATLHVVGRQRVGMSTGKARYGVTRMTSSVCAVDEVARAEQRAEDRDIAEARQLVDLLAGRVLEQAADGQRLAGAELDGGLGLALLDARDGQRRRR